MALPDDLRKILWGSPFGSVYPPKDNPPPPPEDGRTIALRILRQYIAALTFYRLGEVDAQGKRGGAVAFQIPERDIFIEWPDHEEEMRFPSIVFLSGGPADYGVIGLTSYVEEDTRDVYAPGTVVQWMSEYTEKLVVEIWAEKRAMRRALLSGLESALSPTEQMYGIRFRMPDYFDQLVCFSVMGREVFDEQDGARGRRRARLTLDMRFHVVALVNYVSLTTTLKTEVDVDEDTGLATVLDPSGPTDARPLLGIDDIRPLTLPRGPLGPTTPFDDDC
jgi:hypothetical protein